MLTPRALVDPRTSQSKIDCPRDNSRSRPASAGHLVKNRARMQPRIELLEDRTMLRFYPVTSTLDSGPGTLRAAITRRRRRPLRHLRRRLRPSTC